VLFLSKRLKKKKNCVVSGACAFMVIKEIVFCSSE
jgi:hypothetical protein